MFIFDLTPLAYGDAKAPAAPPAGATVTGGGKKRGGAGGRWGGGVGQRGSDGPAAAAWAETQLDLLIEPHITPHALYYQTLPEGEKNKNERLGREKKQEQNHKKKCK